MQNRLSRAAAENEPYRRRWLSLFRNPNADSQESVALPPFYGSAFSELDGAPQTAARLVASVIPTGEAVITDAGSSHLDRFSGKGWLAVGDAAVAFDPLSSQGLSNALANGFYAGHALADDLLGKPGSRDAYEHEVATGYDAYLGELPDAYARFGEAGFGPYW